MIGDSWSHRAARPLVRPLIGRGVTPNHLTTLRLVAGGFACLLFALGTRSGVLWGGVAWLLSAFLDRMDGELARLGRMMSPGGHLYDYYVDQGINVAFFAAVGVGVRHGWLGAAAIPLGLVVALSLALTNWWSEQVEQMLPSGEKVYSGRLGFDPDDALYLMAPAGWLGLFPLVLIGAAITTPVIGAVTLVRLLALRRRRALPPGEARGRGLGR